MVMGSANSCQGVTELVNQSVEEKPLLIVYPEIYVGYPVAAAEIQLIDTSYKCVIGRIILLDCDFDFNGMRK